MDAKSSKRRRPRSKRTYEIATTRRAVQPWTLERGKIASFFLLATLISLVYYFSSSQAFFVHKIRVVGNRFVPAEEIGQSSGLEGMNIFWINPARVEEALSCLASIKEAKVSCRLPREVTIEVVERQPRLLWQWRENRYWVDEEGIVMPARGELEGLLLVKDLSPQLHNRLDPGAVRAALQLKSLLPELKEVQYSPETGIHFRNRYGWLIYLGTGEDMAEKVAIMQALTSQLLAKNIRPKLVDLRFKKPYYK